MVPRTSQEGVGSRVSNNGSGPNEERLMFSLTFNPSFLSTQLVFYPVSARLKYSTPCPIAQILWSDVSVL